MENEPLERLLDTVEDEDTPFKAALAYRLSDITDEDLAVLRERWDDIPVERRRALVRHMARLSETNFELDFARFAALALEDPDPQIRVAAISALWTDDSLRHMRRLINILKTAKSETVRAAAAEGLGRFVLAGELGDIREGAGKKAEEALLTAHREATTQELKRRTLESLSYSGREEIPPLIRAAHYDDDLKMQASALFAMGRSADPQWEEDVLRAMNEREAELRFEAARAAGELMLRNAVPRLVEMLDEADQEILRTAIWSLGEIGGDEAKQALHGMSAVVEDDDLLEAIEEAMTMAMLANGQIAPINLQRDDDWEDDF